MQDTVRTGQWVQYSLVLKHPADMELRFPDSSYAYAPFEFVKKLYFHTSTDLRGISTDSAVYTLATFDTDSVQRLALAVEILNGKDTLRIAAPPDSVLLLPVVDKLPDKPSLVEHTNFQEVPRGINYPYIAAGVGAVLALLGVVYWLFGERIRKAFRLRRMKRRYERFMAEFDKQTADTRDSARTEQGLGLWKHYLENLHDIPYTTFTSKEMAEATREEKLLNALKNIDRAIYGKIVDESTRQSLLFLREFAQAAYQKKTEEVRNA